MLDPKQRSLQFLKDKAEYQSFFARPEIEQPTVQEEAQAEPTAAKKTAADQQITKQATPEQSRTGENK